MWSDRARELGPELAVGFGRTGKGLCHRPVLAEEPLPDFDRVGDALREAKAHHHLGDDQRRILDRSYDLEIAAAKLLNH